MADENTKFQVLADHYNQTFKVQREVSARRDRLFLFLLILLAVILFQLSAPDAVDQIVDQYVNSLVSKESSLQQIDISISFVVTLIWFGLLGLVHTYFQTVLHVERQYGYIYMLENQLAEAYSSGVFTREGEYYENTNKEARKRFSAWTRAIYWILFPILLIVVVVYRVVNIFQGVNSLYAWINGIICLFILVSTGIYLFALHRKRKTQSEESKS